MSLTLPPRYAPKLEPIGRGGFGVVYKTIDQALHVDVAVKVPFQGQDDDGKDELNREVVTELQAAAVLRHPAIIQMLDGGVSPEGSSFLVMEYADEGSMQRWVRDEPPSWDDLAPVLDGVLAGLGHAHAQGLIHRDIKGDNILLRRDRSGRLQPKVADFGLAKLMERRGYRSTRMGAGTLLYMPPEQFEDDTSAIHPGADLYSFGVLAYLILAGRSPYEGAGEFAMIYSKVNSPPIPFTPRPGYQVPPGLDRWLNRLLERKPAERYHLAADARSDLRFLQARPGSVPSLPSEARSLTVDRPLLAAEPTLPGSPPLVEASPPVPPSPALTGFRRPRFVDRDHERAAAWGTARRASQGARGLRISGATGSGRSRLCRWLAQTLEEGGYARTLHVRLDDATGVAEALVRALRHFMYLGTLNGSALTGRIESWLAARGHRDQDDASSLARWLDPAVDAEVEVGVSLQNRLALLGRLLRAEAGRGLGAVWIEDQRADSVGERLASTLVSGARASRFPLLVLWELPGGKTPSLPSEFFEDVEVGPLDGPDVRAFVAELLPEGPVFEQVVTQARGNPRLAVETARLEASNPLTWPDPEAARSSSLSVPTIGGSDTGTPAVETESPTVRWEQRSLAHIGRVRLQAFLTGGGASSVSSALLALLSLLPRPCSPELLRRALLSAAASQQTGPSFGALVDRARAAGLVVALPGGELDFASAPLVDGARELLDREGASGAGFRLAAAEALLALGGERAEAAAAAGRLLLDGGQAERALGLLSDAAERLLARDVEASRRAFAGAVEAAEALGLPPSDPRRAEAILGAARSTRNSGELEAAVKLLEPLGQARLPDAQAGRFLEVRATLELVAGQLDAAIATAQEALERLGSDGDLMGRARSSATLGEALKRRGDLEPAKAALEQALGLAREAGSLPLELDSLARLARCLEALGDRDGAREGFELVLEVAPQIGDLRVEGVALRHLGKLDIEDGVMRGAEEKLRRSAALLERGGYRGAAALTRSELGELARAEGRLEDARADYGAALSTARAFRSTDTRLVALFNLALVEVALGRARRAQRRLAEIDELVPPGTPHGFRPYFEVLRLVLLATAGDWDAAADALDALLDGAWGELPADGDILDLLEQAVGLAAGSEDALLASDACELALELAARAGSEERLERLRRRRAELAGR